MFSFNASGSDTEGKLYVDDVFNTALYTGTGATQHITTGVNLTNPNNYAFAYSGSQNPNGFSIDSLGNIITINLKSGGTYGYLPSIMSVSNNTISWQKYVTDSAAYHYSASVTDSSNNIFVVGTDYQGGYPNILVTKYNSSGTVLWSKSLTSDTNDNAFSIAINSSGDVLVGGGIYGGDSVLLKLSTTTGSIIWQIRIQSAYNGAVLAITTDSNNNVFCAVRGKNYTSIGSYYSTCIMKIDNSGTSSSILWQYGFEKQGNFSTTPSTIVSDSLGNLYIGGAGGNGVGFIAKYNSSGTLQWLNDVTTTTNITDIIFDGTNLICFGYASPNTVVIKINTSGTLLNQYSITNALLVAGYGSSARLYNNTFYIITTQNKILSFPSDGSLFNGYSPWNGIQYNTISSVSVSVSTLTTLSTPAAFTCYASSLTSTNSSSSTSNDDRILLFSPNPGLIWIKKRSGVYSNVLSNTVQDTKYLHSDTSDAAIAGGIGTGFYTTSNGISLTSSGLVNVASDTYVAWTFRKAAKFFDVVTYTGDGIIGRQVPHSLGVAPGMIIIKRTDTTGNWVVRHRGVGGSDMTVYGSGDAMYLNSDASASGTNDIKADTLTLTLGSVVEKNVSGGTYVAYLFAHDTSTDGIIQCGSFTTNGSGNATVNLGWEPQYVMYKNTSIGGGDWRVLDSMRGLTTDQPGVVLFSNNSSAEDTTGNALHVTATGFNPSINPSYTYIYMAIRRSNKPPTSASQVFKAIARTGTGTTATVTGVGFSADLMIYTARILSRKSFSDRLRGFSNGSGNRLYSDGTEAEQTTYADLLQSFTMDGYITGADYTGYGFINYSGDGRGFVNYLFKRAPGFFDEVCYTGNGSYGLQVVNHNLGVIPQFIIVKSRASSDANAEWGVYHYIHTGYGLLLNTNDSFTGLARSTPFTNITSSAITPNAGMAGAYGVTGNYVAYLFATLAGISKVGSYTGNGTSKSIDCGFGNKASGFILIKRTDSTGDWYVWDTARGISSSTEPHLSLNTTTAEVTSDNSVDLSSGGFTVNQNSTTNINVNNGTYIYLSIAGDTYSTGGEAVFTTPGTTTWTAPAGVTQVSVVCVGGGGGGLYVVNGGGGGGGGLGWKNNISVTPGQTYTVQVGAGGISATSAGNTIGGTSYFSSMLEVYATGGQGGSYGTTSSGGTFFPNGGAGGYGGWSSGWNGGGGGAGGYSGNGGHGGLSVDGGGNGEYGIGGAAGGGGASNLTHCSGGGVGLYGEGASGAGGSGGGGGGSGGTNGTASNGNGLAGNYGGGGNMTGPGAPGAVRIIWGSGRAFPNAAG